MNASNQLDERSLDLRAPGRRRHLLATVTRRLWSATAAQCEALERRTLLTLSPAGSEFRVNTFTSGTMMRLSTHRVMGNAGYCFVRANGIGAHTDPHKPKCFVDAEPAPPDTGDLRRLPAKSGALARCYDFASLAPHIRGYFTAFRDIAVGSMVLVPDKDLPGRLYVGEVVSPYEYFTRRQPYENSHRVGVRWDRQGDGAWCAYHAAELRLGIRGGFWTRAFHRLDAHRHRALVEQIEAARERRGVERNRDRGRAQ